MPTPTYVALAKTVLTGSAASVTFSSIVNTYTDLLIVCSARGDSTGDSINVKINNAFGTDSSTNLTGNGSAAASSNASGRSVKGALTLSTDTSNTFASTELYFPNYAGSTFKAVSANAARENNATANLMGATAMLYQTTSAINQIDLIPNTGNFVSGSRFDLYGIKNS